MNSELVMPPPARMGLLVAVKYARRGFAIRVATWHGGVTLQTPSPSSEQIAAAHPLAWITYANGLYTYAEPVSGIRRVARSLDADLADFMRGDWTTLPPEKSNDDLLNPNPGSGSGSGSGGSGSGSGSPAASAPGVGISGGAGVGDGSRPHDCGQGMYWDGAACRRLPGAVSQPTLTLIAEREESGCTLEDPVTNTFHTSLKVNDWGGAKPGDIWFLRLQHGSPGGLVIDATGAQAVGGEITASFELSGHPGQTFTVFGTAWKGGGMNASAQARIALQGLCRTVVFAPNGGGGTMADQNRDVPTALTANAFSRAGHTFGEWNTESDGSGDAYADGAIYPFAVSANLYAQWVADSHTVTFAANEGTGSMSPQTNNAPAALTANAFTRAGYVFDGWNTAANGSGTAYADGASYNFAADVTLYAQWTVATFTVTFNANSGSGSMSPQTESGPTALDANSFTRAGYDFSGWNTAANGSGTAYADGATYAFDVSITLYAQWTVAAYTVTFNANSGSGSMSPQTESGPTALDANSFTRAGYVFDGWNTASDGSGTAYADGGTYPFDADVTLYAQWELAPHTVTFNGNGSDGGSMSDQTANAPTALTANAYTRTGFTFSGWNTASDGSGTAYTDGATYGFSSDATLYAQWT